MDIYSSRCFRFVGSSDGCGERHGRPYAILSALVRRIGRIVSSSLCGIHLYWYVGGYDCGSGTCGHRDGSTHGYGSTTHGGRCCGRFVLWRQSVVYLRHHRSCHTHSGLQYARQIPYKFPHCFARGSDLLLYLCDYRIEGRPVCSYAATGASFLESSSLCFGADSRNLWCQRSISALPRHVAYGHCRRGRWCLYDGRMD